MWNGFVEYRKNFPRIWFLFALTAVVNAVCLFSIGSEHYGLAAQVSNYLTFSFSVVSLGLLVALLRRRWDRVIFVYVLAFLPPVAAAVVQIGVTQGFVGRNAITTNVYQAASISHINLLGLAFILRMRRIKTEQRQARQEAWMSSRLADEQRKVVAMLSHEFRSPLAAIDRAAEMIEIGCAELNEAARERIQRIRAHPGRLVVRDESAMRCLQADAELLCVALGNIIENGFRYSPPDSPVTLRTTYTEEKEGNVLRFEVADRGAGMLPEEAEKVGALYFRGKSSAGTQGSGLGLYIARRVIDAHGGRLVVASRPGEGTQFTVSLRGAFVQAQAGVRSASSMDSDSESRVQRAAPWNT